jgi:hypothetical protein
MWGIPAMSDDILERGPGEERNAPREVGLQAGSGAGLEWVTCRLVAGHGVASGRSPATPYPAGTIALQRPCFAAVGIDLAPYFPGTLNLDASPRQWRLRQPDAHVEHLHWTDLHPPETFSFWHCRLRRPPAGAPAPPDTLDTLGGLELGDLATEGGLAALIYHPHPQTKRAHHQGSGCLEVLAPWIEGLAQGQELELAVDPRRCRLVDPRRLRARLLEFLKFRVLAAQAEFFRSLEAAPREPEHDPGAALAVERLRAWLAPLWPEALDLDNDDLRATFEQARRLYGP